MEKIVLAYSGGLTTTVAIPWLRETYEADVIAVTLDLGQGRELDDIRERALAAGAARAHVLDVREEFAGGFLLPALQAGAALSEAGPVASALGRALIARHLVKIAAMEGSGAVAHGAAAGSDDIVRLERSVRALDAGIRIIAARSEWGLSRAGMVAYAAARGLPLATPAERPYSIDANLWGRAITGGPLDDAWIEPPEEAFALTRPAAAAPDVAAHVDVEFERGVPIRINGVAMPFSELVGSLETIAGAHGVGRVDATGRTAGGATRRQVCELPAAVVLHAAHLDLEALVLPRDLREVKRQLAHTYADLVHAGQWYSTLREAIDAFVGQSQAGVTGTARLRLFKGGCRSVGRRSTLAPHHPATSHAPAAAAARAEA